MNMAFSNALAAAAERVDSLGNGSPMQQVSIDLIEVEHRIRPLTHDQVEGLKASIADVGLLNPITVYRCSIRRGGEEVDGFRLIAGAHRLAACRDLDFVEIPARIVEMDRPRRIIAECDENLCTTVLTPAERALFTNRRKEAYEQLHPETVNGENQHTRVRQVGEGSAASRFTANTAASTGQSERKVQRDAERGAKVASDVLARVKGTKLNTGVYLDQLKELSPSEQEKRVLADLEALEDERRKAADGTNERARTAHKGSAGKKTKGQK